MRFLFLCDIIKTKTVGKIREHYVNRKNGDTKMFDLLIKNASIIDGTGAEPFIGDVAVKNGKIKKIGKIDDYAERMIDAEGLTLTPGWIDSHSHSDRTFFSFPDQREKIEQGITFSITGQCGGSAAPLIREDGTVETVGQYFERLSSVPQGSGAALLVGHNTVRKAVMNTEKRAPSPEEMQRMKDLVEDAMKNGALGMSLGLYYVPGCYSEIDEVIELGKIVAKYGGIIASHIRNENDGLIEASREFIDIIKATGCRAVFSHHKAMDKNNWGKVKNTLEMIDKANSEGADIYVDVYPYIASSTSMTSRFLPSQFHPPMSKSVIELLKDEDICNRAKAWGRAKWGNDLSWVIITVCGGHPEYSGKTVNEIADMKGQTDRFDTVFDIMREGNGLSNICTFMMCEDDVEYVMKHPRAMLCTDAAVRTSNTYCHPRMIGSFPRILGRYVRERRVTSLPEMIRKMTSLPAKVYGLSSKGIIAEGYEADICIFDADRIIDTADFINFDLPNKGIEYVVIGGKIVCEKGKYNGVRAAEVMRIKK